MAPVFWRPFGAPVKRRTFISCTSGQLRCLQVFLKGEDISKWFEERLEEAEPFGNWTDANLLYKMTTGQWQPIRLSTLEFPYDIAATSRRIWADFCKYPWNFSFFREVMGTFGRRVAV